MRTIKKIIMLLGIAVLAFSGCKKNESTEEVIIQKEVRVIEKTKLQNTEEKDFLIAIDPGHQGWHVDMSASEPNAPGSPVMKMKATSGTAGKYSGIPEFQLNLDISLMLKASLEEKGYAVIMAREDNDTAISNSERAILANEAGADVSVRIHANGSENPASRGALALVMSPKNAYTGHLFEKSDLLARCVLDAYCEKTGMKNLGIQQNDTMTGINWSEIPVMILEMGFMSNESDDLKMANEEFRVQMVEGIVEGIEAYYEKTKGTGKDMSGLNNSLKTRLQEAEANGESWSIYVKNLNTGEAFSVEDKPMESASVIKLFTAATVFENWDEMQSRESYEGEIRELLRNMIRISDNESANALVRKLGNGDAAKGMQKVNVFCEKYGYTQTHMGRLMLDFNASDDNYTSVEDCGKLLTQIYQKELSGSEEILKFMKEQERTGKLPAGIPQGIVVANKTGELDDTENDVAIVYGEKADYVVCVMAGALGNTASARSRIVDISSEIYQYINQ